jgi:signal transduction histidine kinase
MSQEQVARLGALPRGLGLLGAVLHKPGTMRVADISKDVRSVGFPPGHPPMKGLLAVPLLSKRRVYGNFYLTNRRGGADFDDEDEQLLVAIAAHASVAVENATLFAETSDELHRKLVSLERAERRANFLVDLSGLLPSGPLVVDLPFEKMLEGTAALLGDACALYFVDPAGSITSRCLVDRNPARRDAADHYIAESWPYLFEHVFGRSRSLLVEEAVPRELGGPDPKLLGKHNFSAMIALPLISPKGKHGIFVTLGSRPLRFTPEDLGFAVVVTERLAAAIANATLVGELREIARVREELISIATHELRTPVTVLMTYSKLLAKQLGDVAEAPRRALEAIERQTRRLARLTDELLDVTRIGAGRMELQRVEVELGKFVTDAVARFCVALPALDQARVKLTVSNHSIRGAWDEMRLEQVLINLLSNAEKFSPEGGDISVAVSRKGDVGCVSVGDRGIGVPSDQQGRLFEPFFRASSEAARRIPGAGLGLHICKSIVELHGGNIWFHSEEGGGSTFNFTLPLSNNPRVEQLS